MTDHPSTLKAKDTVRTNIEWDDRAELHRVGAGDGVMSGASSLRDGSFAELIAHMMLLPEEERADYYIEKLGDREYHAEEVTALAADPTFPQT